MNESSDYLNAYSGLDLEIFLKQKIHERLEKAEELKDLYTIPDNRMAIKGCEGQIKDMITQEEIMAGMEKDEKGKPKYGNEKIRSARAKQVVEKDSEYITLKRELKRLRDLQFERDIRRNGIEADIRALDIVLSPLSKIYERETLILKSKERITL